MTNLIIAIVIIAVFFFQLVQVKLFSKRTKKNIYQWWHIPWFALLYCIVMYLVYWLANVPELPLINQLQEGFQVEAVYCLFCHVVWILIRMLFRLPFMHKGLIGLYRKVFATNHEDKDKALPFPYFIDDNQVVKARVGQVFYRWTLKTVVLFVWLIYLVGFLLVHFANLDFYLISAFGILGALPIIDYYVYLCAEVPVEAQVESTEVSNSSDFDELWRIYVDTFDDYSVAWKRSDNEEDALRRKRQREDNDEKIANLMQNFTDNHAHSFIENCDLVSAFTRLEPFVDQVEKNGQHVLIALEIPNHFSQKQEKSFTEEIAERMEEITKKHFHVYDEKSTMESLHESVVVAALSLISRQGLDYEWMSKIGLIVVVNIFDKAVSNLYESRKFCYILKSVNEDYQVLFVTTHRRGIEPSLKNTWLTSSITKEAKLWQFSQGDRQFFIGYDYEDYANRFSKILISRSSEPLYSGSEMVPIALSYRYGKRDKIVTPIHYLELAYTYAVEGPEELGKFSELLNTDLFEIKAVDVNKNINSHLLPVDPIVDEQVFSVVFDQENNAPLTYNKWRHLGIKENFLIIISKPYLYRDYFNANHDYFVSAPFASLEPMLCKSKITLAIILINMLKDAENGMEESEIRDLLTGYYAEEEIRSVPTLIKDLFNIYFSSELANMLKTTEVVDFDGKAYHHHTVYRLELNDSVDLSYLDTVTVKDESGNVLLEVLMDLLYQNYNKGQLHSFSGKPYIISDFDKRSRTLKVRSKNTNDQEVILYKPQLKVVLGPDPMVIKDMRKSEVHWNHRISGQELSFCKEGFETEVIIETEQLYSFTSYRKGSYRSKDNCPPPRIYKKGKVLKVSFGYIQKPEYCECIDDIRKSLQILIYESLRSLFPYHAQYLIVASEGEGDKELPWIFGCFENHSQQFSNDSRINLTYYFIEDAHVDLGLIGALADKDNLWYMFSYIYDYLIWLSEGEPVTPSGYDAYLNSKNNDKLRFLKYGTNSLPAYFDINLLINFIRDFFENGDKLQEFVTNRQNKQDAFGNCDFCNRKMKNSEMQRLKDGRMRCPDCSVDAIDTYEQFHKLCDEAKGLFKTHLGIDFGTIPFKENLVSAVALHKRHGSEFSITNGYDVRKLVGFAWNSEGGAIYVEDGRKSGETLGIIIHEMTHIWEFSDDEFKKIRATNEDWLEGLAVWTDLYLSEKAGVATMEERKEGWLARDDEYGRGLKLILDTCPDDPYGYIHDAAKNIP